MAVKIQTSLLTPPFGCALLYLKGAAGGAVSMGYVYRGIVPFVALQTAFLGLLVRQPGIVPSLPEAVLK